jgi:hypothetical protein
MTNLTSAQIHLAVNHLPVFAALFATAALAAAALIRRSDLRRLGLGLAVFAGLSVLPVYLSGEGAEETVEHRPGVSETLIERHEDAAGWALGAIVAAGAVAALGLGAVRLGREGAARHLTLLSLLVTLVASAALARTAHLGGQIRHDEIRAAAATAPAAARRGADDD